MSDVTPVAPVTATSREWLRMAEETITLTERLTTAALLVNRLRVSLDRVRDLSCRLDAEAAEGPHTEVSDAKMRCAAMLRQILFDADDAIRAVFLAKEEP